MSRFIFLLLIFIPNHLLANKPGVSHISPQALSIEGKATGDIDLDGNDLIDSSDDIVSFGDDAITLTGGYKLNLEGTDTYIYSSGDNIIDFYANSASIFQLAAALATLTQDLNLASGKRIYGTTTPLVLGATGTTAQSLDADGVLVGGKLEVKDDTYIYGTTYIYNGAGYGSMVHDGSNYVISASVGYPYFNGGLMVNANKQVVMGNNSESIIEFETTQTTDSLAIGVGIGSNSLLVMSKNNMTTNYGFTQQDEPSVIIITTKGAGTYYTSKVESVTFAGNPGDASKTTVGSIIPLGAFVVGVSSRVTTAGTNCTSFDLGVSGDTNQFGGTLAITQGSTSDNTDATATFANPQITAAEEIIVTANGGNCFDMVVAITVHYINNRAASID